MKHCADPAFMKHWVRIGSLLFCLAGFGQDIAIGTWRTHYSYQNARILESTEDKIFCAVENGLFSYSLSDNSIRKLSKLDGLSGAGISAMQYDDGGQVLIIGYSSGLIDLVYDNRIETLREVAESKLEGEKKINAATSAEGKAYLATNFGIIVIDLLKSQISESFEQIGSSGTQVTVSEIDIRNNRLFIVTDEGIQSGMLDQNLLDFNNWTMYGSTFDLKELTVVGNEVYALNGNNLFRLNNVAWESTNYDLPEGAEKLFGINDLLYTCSGNAIFKLNGETFDLEMTTAASKINDLQLLGGKFYMADAEAGLLDEAGNPLSPSGPLEDTYSNIEILDNEVYGFHAPSIDEYDGSQEVESYSQFSDGSWNLMSIEDFSNVSDVSFYNNSRYFSSIGYGLYSEGSNEIITDIPTSEASVDSVITSLDSSGQMWLAGTGSQPIHSLDQEGNWQSYNSISVFDTEFIEVDIAESGIAWVLASDGDITVIDESANEIDILGGSDGIPSAILDFYISIEDNAWVATTRGPAFFPSASSVFFDSEALRPTFDNSILFEDQQVNSVATDGGNRVWFGTNRGLWVFDENTSEQVAVFSEKNSPLPSDVILDLAYNGISGEVFMVTDKGLVSYRSASSNGSRVHSNVAVFPNPVRPSFNGQVGISGLARNVTLKVTDMNGNLVKELQANGGSASWDLLDRNGSMVVTGIYFLFSSTADGEESFVGKVAVVR